MDAPRPEAGPPPAEAPDVAVAVPARDRRSWLGWRIGTPTVVLLSGALFAVSAANSDGTDLRPGRYTDLATLVQSESDAYEQLQEQAAELKTEVDDLAAGVEDRAVRRKQRQADKLRGPANVDAVSGAGVTVVLADAPIDKIEDAIDGASDGTGDGLERFLVHQQDIQAVVNALWAGGATAVTIQGQRIVTTTGIKCTGSAVQLQGVPYPQPYTIQAVGVPDSLISSIDADADVAAFRSDAAQPDIGLGFTLEPEDAVEAPAYEGLLDISYAQPSG